MYFHDGICGFSDAELLGMNVGCRHTGQRRRARRIAACPFLPHRGKQNGKWRNRPFHGAEKIRSEAAYGVARFPAP